MKVPKRFTIHTTSRCLLRCKFCWLNDYNLESDIMTLEEFKKIAKWLKAQGIKEIDLTPMVGEFFTHKNPLSYIDILDSLGFEIHILTSGCVKLPDLRVYKSLHLYFSIYGNNKEEFKDLTTKDYFDALLDNLKTIKTHNQVSVVLRNSEIIAPELKLIFKCKNFYVVNYELYNRQNRYSRDKYFEDGCRFLQEPVIHSRGISSCCMDFQKNRFIIGEVGDDLEELYKNLEVNYCNKGCGWYQKDRSQS